MADANVLLETGVHAGRALKELSDMELRRVWSGHNGHAHLRKEWMYKVLTRELARRERKPCPSWALPEPSATETIPADERVEYLLKWMSRHATGFMLVCERDQWVVSCNVFEGWQTDSDLRQALLKARNAVRQNRQQPVASAT